MKNKSLLFGLIAGAAAGAIAGVLLAPDKGAKTRKKVLDKSREKMDHVKSGINNLFNAVSDKFSDSTVKSAK